MQNHRVAGAIAYHIENATADQLCRRDGSAIGELHTRRRPQGSREVPFCVFDAMLTEKKDVVLCEGRDGIFVCCMFSMCLLGRIFGFKSVAYLGLCGSSKSRSGREFCYDLLIEAEGVWSSTDCGTATLSSPGEKREIAMLK
jgi:hypothetical protein